MNKGRSIINYLLNVDNQVVSTCYTCASVVRLALVLLYKQKFLYLEPCYWRYSSQCGGFYLNILPMLVLMGLRLKLGCNKNKMIHTFNVYP